MIIEIGPVLADAILQAVFGFSIALVLYGIFR